MKDKKLGEHNQEGSPMTKGGIKWFWIIMVGIYLLFFGGLLLCGILCN